MKRFLYGLTVAALQLMSFGTQAGNVEFSPAAQAGFEWHYGASQSAANHASLSLAVGYTPTYGDGLRFGAERVGQTDFLRLQQDVLPLIDARISTERGTDALRVAGFSVLARPLSQDAVNGGDQSWFSNNWGWVAAAGVAVVAVAAVAAGSGGGSDSNAAQANHCNITIIGGSPNNTSGCPK